MTAAPPSLVLPGVLGEIAEIAGAPAALAVAREMGGRRAYFPAKPKADHWLVRAVGAETAAAICAHLVAGGTGLEIPVPLGPTGSRAQVWSTIQRALSAGETSGRAAQLAGVDERTIRRHRNGHSGARRSGDPDQGELF
ncbi:MAG TPA: hypothetical protein VD995_02775 [Azospirillum sp.]|nr:hypothetical protein [Azospirillum sp.]